MNETRNSSEVAAGMTPSRGPRGYPTRTEGVPRRRPATPCPAKTRRGNGGNALAGGARPPFGLDTLVGHETASSPPPPPNCRVSCSSVFQIVVSKYVTEVKISLTCAILLPLGTDGVDGKGCTDLSRRRRLKTQRFFSRLLPRMKSAHMLKRVSHVWLSVAGP